MRWRDRACRQHVSAALPWDTATFAPSSSPPPHQPDAPPLKDHLLADRRRSLLSRRRDRNGGCRQRTHPCLWRVECQLVLAVSDEAPPLRTATQPRQQSWIRSLDTKSATRHGWLLPPPPNRRTCARHTFFGRAVRCRPMSSSFRQQLRNLPLPALSMSALVSLSVHPASRGAAGRCGFHPV